jgi:hypothetical protein
MNEQPIGDPSTNLQAGSLSTPAGEGAAPPPLAIEANAPASGDDAHRPDLAEFSAQPIPKFDKSGSRQAQALAIAVAGWLVPGLGHALLKMWGRALAVFITVGVLVIIGAGMRGNIFDSSGMDAFDRLGYFADLGTGCFYFLARAIERLGADVSHANGDYGTRFLATAGILNLLSALHAFEAARGHKA